MDDLPLRQPDDALAALRRQDLDPLSVDELTERIAALEAEIVRVKAKLAGAGKVRNAADELFKR